MISYVDQRHAQNALSNLNFGLANVGGGWCVVWAPLLCVGVFKFFLGKRFGGCFKKVRTWEVPPIYDVKVTK